MNDWTHPLDQDGYLGGDSISERQDAVDDLNAHLERASQRAAPARCPVCGGLNPGDITHTRCATSGYEGL